MSINRKMLILILFLAAGCNQKKSKVNLLANNDYKFWDFSYKGGRGAFYFDDKNNFRLCNYSPVNNHRNTYDFGDLIVSNRWEFIGRDSLIINNEKYWIMELSRDSLKLVRNGFSVDSFFCVVSPDQRLK
jgi:hypothetical protein